MKYPAQLHISFNGGAQNSAFRSVEDAKAVLERFSVELAKIKEFSNRDEDPIFRYEGAGAFYAVDLRKCTSAVVEIADEWADVCAERSVERLAGRRDMKVRIEMRGLRAEFDEFERRKPEAA